MDLSDYSVRDLVGKTWSLSGVLAPGATVTVKRKNQPMAMNNNGDSIDLVDPAGMVLQTVTYASASEGEEILP